jgi:HK97 gp10 family phage protein
MIGAQFLAQLPQLLQRILNESGQNIAKHARDHAPRAGGNLANSVEVSAAEQSVSIAVTAPYASVVELGTSRRAPQPFLRPALAAERTTLRERILHELNAHNS